VAVSLMIRGLDAGWLSTAVMMTTMTIVGTTTGTRGRTCENTDRARSLKTR